MDEIVRHYCSWITVNRLCNMDCFWCYDRYGEKAELNMHKDLLFDLIDMCGEGGVKKVVFLGGEPLIYPYLSDGLKRCKEKGMLAEITTNGLLLSDKTHLDALLQAGLDSVMLSLKGSNRDNYIHTTGIDCFDSIVKAIDNLSGCGIKFGLSAVLTASFIEHLDDLMELLSEKGARLIVFSFLKEPQGAECDRAFFEANSPEILLPMFYDKLKTVAAAKTMKWLVECCCPITELEKEIEYFFDGRFHCSCKNHKLVPLAFDTFGRLLYCNTLPDITYGQYGVDFKTYEQMQQFIRQNIG
ncbi:MAG: radical SAM protein [Bacteroidales bacterium]|nr:radical SAM protein [Bacteroidales bacterium]